MKNIWNNFGIIAGKKFRIPGENHEVIFGYFPEKNHKEIPG